jgi:hypothetical protein
MTPKTQETMAEYRRAVSAHLDLMDRVSQEMLDSARRIHPEALKTSDVVHLQALIREWHRLHSQSTAQLGQMVEWTERIVGGAESASAASAHRARRGIGALAAACLSFVLTIIGLSLAMLLW